MPDLYVTRICSKNNPCTEVRYKGQDVAASALISKPTNVYQINKRLSDLHNFCKVLVSIRIVEHIGTMLLPIIIFIPSNFLAPYRAAVNLLRRRTYSQLLPRLANNPRIVCVRECIYCSSVSRHVRCTG